MNSCYSQDQKAANKRCAEEPKHYVLSRCILLKSRRRNDFITGVMKFLCVSTVAGAFEELETSC